MQLKRLTTTGFRNLQSATLRTDARFVVLHGPNAQGKTNTLEAIWTLATLKALRTHRMRDLVAWEQEAAEVRGQIGSPQGPRDLAVRIDGGRRTAELDGQTVRDVGEYFDTIRAIAAVPAHGRIVTDEPAQRRTWLDRAAFTLEPTHLQAVRAYRRVLAQKAQALRDRTDPAVLDVLDAQLAAHGAELVSRRAAVLDRLRPHVERLHGEMSEGARSLALGLRSAAKGTTPAERRQALSEALEGARAEERRRRRCLVGPQSDEVLMTLDGKPARHFGSQGQIRSVVLALKLAELTAAREQGLSPLFLLDDLSGELDARRTARLLELLTELGTQVWVTTTDPALVGTLPEATAEITVEGGTLAVLCGPAQVDPTTPMR